MLHRRLDRLSIKLLPEEHQLLRELRSAGVCGRPFIVAVSGGLDSVVMLHMLVRLKPLVKSKIYITHIHHGFSKDLKIVRYREQALVFVRKMALQLKLGFMTNKSQPKKVLYSEEELRDFRYAEFEKIYLRINKKEKRKPLIVTAHHQDDLLETQVMRLIRGTGQQGLAAIKFCDGKKLRPLILISKIQLKAVARKLALKWIDDPTNYSVDVLRNWVRRKWLPQLEKKVPGSNKSLARSLSLLATEKSDVNKRLHLEQMIVKNKIICTDYAALKKAEQKILILMYLKKLKIDDYTHGQVQEIVRQLVRVFESQIVGRSLDNGRGKYTFTVLRHEWSVNAQVVQAKKI